MRRWHLRASVATNQAGAWPSRGVHVQAEAWDERPHGRVGARQCAPRCSAVAGSGPFALPLLGTGDEGLTTSPSQDGDADRRVGLDAGEPGSQLFVHTVAAASARLPNQTS